MEQPYSDIDRQESEFEIKYKRLLSGVGHGKIGADNAHVMLMLDYAKLKNNPDASRVPDCERAPQEIRYDQKYQPQFLGEDSKAK